MHISVKILGTKPRQRYSVRRLVTIAHNVLLEEYPDLEVDILKVKTGVRNKQIHLCVDRAGIGDQ